MIKLIKKKKKKNVRPPGWRFFSSPAFFFFGLTLEWIINFESVVYILIMLYSFSCLIFFKVKINFYVWKKLASYTNVLPLWLSAWNYIKQTMHCFFLWSSNLTSTSWFILQISWLVFHIENWSVMVKSKLFLINIWGLFWKKSRKTKFLDLDPRLVNIFAYIHLKWRVLRKYLPAKYC